MPIKPLSSSLLEVVSLAPVEMDDDDDDDARITLSSLFIKIPEDLPVLSVTMILFQMSKKNSLVLFVINY